MPKYGSAEAPAEDARSLQAPFGFLRTGTPVIAMHDSRSYESHWIGREGTISWG